MEHHFNIKLAQLYGIEESIILHHFYYWIVKNAINEKHWHDGLYWTYNSNKAYSEFFTYMNKAKIARVIKHLEEEGIIVKNNFNSDRWDKTNWYAITQKGLKILRDCGYDMKPFPNVLQDENCDKKNEIHRMTQNASIDECKMRESNDAKCVNRMIQNETTIPNNNTYNKNIYNNKEIEDKSSTKKKPRATFIPPTLDEVEAYIKEKGYHFSAKAFIDYYAADDWHLGYGASRHKVSNWKQCCVTWENKRTSDNGLFAQDKPQQDNDEILLKRIYETMPESEQAKILQLDPYSYHMLPEKGKNIYREARKQLMLDWLKEHNE